MKEFNKRIWAMSVTVESVEEECTCICNCASSCASACKCPDSQLQQSLYNSYSGSAYTSQGGSLNTVSGYAGL